jgi:hypothetical protein
VASLAKSAGQFRDVHFQAYLPSDAGGGPPAVLRVADVEFTKAAIDRVTALDFDPKRGFWHRADVSQNMDDVLIGEVDRQALRLGCVTGWEPVTAPSWGE